MTLIKSKCENMARICNNSTCMYEGVCVFVLCRPITNEINIYMKYSIK